MSISKECINCSNIFYMEQIETDFFRRASPIINDKVFLIPLPEKCPACREQILMSWRNEINLFKRTCDSTGKQLISMFPQDTQFPVVKNSIWWSDQTDNMTHGIDINWNESVFAQIYKLQKVCSYPDSFKLAEDTLENSLYTNCSGNLKDCYLSYAIGSSEKCMYGYLINDSYECVDCLMTYNSQSCYECVCCFHCHDLLYGFNCGQCHSSYHLYDCKSSSDCIACVDLRQKQFCVLNKQYTKEQYLKIKERFLTDEKFSDNLRLQLINLARETPRLYITGVNNHDSSGCYLWNTKNCFDCYNTLDSEDCRYTNHFFQGKDSQDVYAWGQMELCYQISGGGDGQYNSLFTAASFGCRECIYTIFCMYCQNCFGCVGLKNKKYCIFNKQYTSEEYYLLLQKLLEMMNQQGEWGTFFPMSASSWNYNKSSANEFYPLTENEVKAKGLNWYTDESEVVENQLNSDPNLIDEEVLLKSTLICKSSNKPYRINRNELEFYRSNKLKIPEFCPDVRQDRRLKTIAARWKISRKCCYCNSSIQTCYTEEIVNKVSCLSCYEARI